MFKGCFLKATGLIPRFFLDGRINDCADKGAAGAVEGGPGCQGEGLELPTSLPASEAENRKYWISSLSFIFRFQSIFSSNHSCHTRKKFLVLHRTRIFYVWSTNEECLRCFSLKVASK